MRLDFQNAITVAPGLPAKMKTIASAPLDANSLHRGQKLPVEDDEMILETGR